MGAGSVLCVCVYVCVGEGGREVRMNHDRVKHVGSYIRLYMYIPSISMILHLYIFRQVTRAKSKSGAVVKHQWMFMVLKTTSNTKQLFKSGAAPLYRSLVTSLILWYI